MVGMPTTKSRANRTAMDTAKPINTFLTAFANFDFFIRRSINQFVVVQSFT